MRVKTKQIRYHAHLIETINEFKRPRWGKLVSRKKALNGIKVHFKQDSNEFSLRFRQNRTLTKSARLELGNYYRNVRLILSNRTYIIERLYLGTHSPPEFLSNASRIHTVGYSTKVSYYYQLIIPLVKEIQILRHIQECGFPTDLGYFTICGTRATIHGENVNVSIVNTEVKKKKQFYLVLDSDKKQTFDEFEKKTFAVTTTLGYLTGQYPADQGYFFAYGNKQKKQPKHFRFTQFRGSISCVQTPTNSNSHSWLYKDRRLADKYYKTLRNVSLTEFSRLCEKVHDSVDLSSVLLLILESSVASLLFRPGGYAIALETLSDLILGREKDKLTPIKSKPQSRQVRKELISALRNHESLLEPAGFKTLQNRINQLNQPTNKSRLLAPFEHLGIELLDEDLKVLETRNDFLHGRVPDLTKAGLNRSLDRLNRDMYYASIRFYTLLNILILKWVGYDNRVINYPKINESYTEIHLNEEPFREV